MALIFFVLRKFFVSNFSVHLFTAVLKAATVAKRHYVGSNLRATQTAQ